MGVIQYLGEFSNHSQRLRHARRTPSRIAFLNQRWAHHGRHSGYLLDCGIGLNVPRNDRIMPHPLQRACERVFGSDNLDAKLTLRRYLKAFGAKLLHIVDGDFDDWARHRRIPGVKLTATFHQPVDRLVDIVADAPSHVLDGIICVSRNQIPHLAHLVNPGRCIFVPHGVDVEFFAPRSGDRGGRKVVLSVGVHRRDFQVLIEAAKVIRRRRPDVTVRLVGPREQVNRVGEASGGAIEVLCGLTDEQLRNAYQEAAVVLLPLQEATANNALLEASACRTPVVVTDLPAIRDYFSEKEVAFCPAGDVRSHVDATVRFLEDPAHAASMAAAANAAVQRYAWRNVRGEATRFFEQIIGPVGVIGERERHD